ncbi:ras-related and estrogen-regulated growth inhibitor [Dermacentor silvarum]|uniref:ras-related and estrogen-regulated growth inhibitor n=1 Tax=Dermacentor silvarum TaxID=543639 RepID=UPI00189AC798|nr:ras-related and estrogen-regulated growth inhibitor [Dermacentor silvarum]
MSSNAIRGIRRKKSTLSEVKIAVLGASGVGKSALVVRFLTKRYIGEYDHQTENRYKSEMMVDGEPVLFEILDTCPRSEDELPRDEILQWADGFMLVYSIVDRASFRYLGLLRRHLNNTLPNLHRAATLSNSAGGPAGAGGAPQQQAQQTPVPAPVCIVANKADLIHLRQVSTEEGEILAKDADDGFVELTASEQVHQVAQAFADLCRDVYAHRRRSKQSLLDRVFFAGTKSIAAKANDPAGGRK